MKKLGLLITWGLLTSIVGCAYIPLPGGKLTGTPSTSLQDWQEIANISIIQLETAPESPYSVNVWMIAEQDRLYVYSGDNRTQWVQNIEENNAVRVQAEEKIYDFTANRVTTAKEFEQFATAWKTKYSSDIFDTNAADTYLFRLE